MPWGLAKLGPAGNVPKIAPSLALSSVMLALPKFVTQILSPSNTQREPGYFRSQNFLDSSLNLVTVLLVKSVTQILAPIEC
jgi:hypothetical protein